MYGVDINEDGEQSGAINYDMLFNTRSVQSCIGAMEYGGITESAEPEEVADSVDDITIDNTTFARKILFNDQILIVTADHTYNILGQQIQ
jgi:hypothetical protein